MAGGLWVGWRAACGWVGGRLVGGLYCRSWTRTTRAAMARSASTNTARWSASLPTREGEEGEEEESFFGRGRRGRRRAFSEEEKRRGRGGRRGRREEEAELEGGGRKRSWREGWRRKRNYIHKRHRILPRGVLGHSLPHSKVPPKTKKERKAQATKRLLRRPCGPTQ
jgi:hypothetical protein